MEVIILSLVMTVAILVAHYSGFYRGFKKGGDIAMEALREVFFETPNNKKKED